MHALEMEVRQTIADNTLLVSGTAVVVGVSGGPDSMALLHLLAALRACMQLTLHVVYVDHGLRPAEIGDEISLVTRTAAELGLSCESVRVDTMTRMREKKRSLEHSARDLRYQVFHRVAKRLDDGVICVGHTADDQVEEILLRLLRGSGRRGLSGMRLRSGRVIRPLLGITRERILAYLHEQNIAFCHDTSNEDCRFLRNRVRHELLPYLEERFDPGVRNALLKTAASLAEDEALLKTLTDEAWKQVIEDRSEGVEPAELLVLLDRGRFSRLHTALQRRVVERLLWQLGCRARYAHILLIIRAARHGTTSSQLHLSRGLRLIVKHDVLSFSYPRGRVRGRI